jgi:hypothetical protein
LPGQQSSFFNLLHNDIMRVIFGESFLLSVSAEGMADGLEKYRIFAGFAVPYNVRRG